jgi:hypothetical protein
MASRDYPQSLYIEPSRPDLPRNRSYSLPVGLAMMNAQEAGILFSAAERATARRRKMKSIDTPPWTNTPSSSRPASPLPAVQEVHKPSPLAQVALAEERFSISNHDDEDTTPKQPEHNIPAPISISNNASAATNPIIQSLPLSPASPKRKVPTLSLKNYADGLFTFTHSRLSSKLPTNAAPVTTPSPQQQTPPTPPPEEQDSSYGTFKMRPLLKSRFSDWSAAADSVPQSRRDSVADTPDDLGVPLLSPDSFFDGEYTPTRNFSRFSGVSCASSETYDPTSTGPLLTPPHQDFGLASGPKEEINYFTNFQHFLDRQSSYELENSAADSDSTASAPDEVAIELSPFDLHQFPSPPMRPRADTVVRKTHHGIRSQSFIIEARSNPLLNICSPNSAPASPYHTAELAVRVPHGLIGAIG